MSSDLDRIEKEINLMRDLMDKLTEKNDRQTLLIEEQMENRMDQAENLKLLLLLIKGNELDRNDGGLIGTIRGMQQQIMEIRKENNERFKPLENFKDRFVWVVSGVSFLLGIVGTVLTIILKFKQ